jgi:hypothetical protein
MDVVSRLSSNGIKEPSDCASFYYPELNEFKPQFSSQEDEDIWNYFYNAAEKINKELMK